MPKPRCGTTSRVIDLLRAEPRSIEFLHRAIGGDREQLTWRLARLASRRILVRVSLGVYGLGENAAGVGNGNRSKGATYPGWLTPPRPAARPARRIAFDEEEQLTA